MYVPIYWFMTIDVHFSWWVLQHCTGFARLVWGRLRFTELLLIQIDLCVIRDYWRTSHSYVCHNPCARYWTRVPWPMCKVLDSCQSKNTNWKRGKWLNALKLTRVPKEKKKEQLDECTERDSWFMKSVNECTQIGCGEPKKERELKKEYYD